MVFVRWIRPEYLLVRDGPEAPEKAIARAHEQTRVGGVRVHPCSKLVDPDGAKVNSVTNEVKLGYLVEYI